MTITQAILWAASDEALLGEVERRGLSTQCAGGRGAFLHPTTRAIAREILNAVCEVFEVSEEAIYSKRRRMDEASARHALIVLMRKRLNLSSTELGEWFGRDHSSILYAVAGQEGRMTDERYAQKWRVLEARFLKGKENTRP
jgi:hypothetical protein